LFAGGTPSKAWKHPATIIASLALFVALSGGTALAGGLSGLISGKKIVDHSIAEKKLTGKAIAALSGGGLGDDDSAYTVASSAGQSAVPLPTNKWVTLKSLSLPGGSYVVMAKTTIGTSGNADTRCALDADNSQLGWVIDDNWAGEASPNSQLPLSLVGTVDSSPESTVTLDCRSYQPNASAYGSNLVAIKVESVTGSN